MKEKTLTKVCAAGTAASILALYIFTTQISSPRVSIGDIDRTFSGRTVNITGEITSLSESGGNYFLEIEDETGSIKVVIWGDALAMGDASGQNLSKGNEMNVIGEVQIYKGELEIIPMRGNVRTG